MGIGVIQRAFTANEDDPATLVGVPIEAVRVDDPVAAPNRTNAVGDNVKPIADAKGRLWGRVFIVDSAGVIQADPATTSGIGGGKTLQDIYTRQGDGSATTKVRNSGGTVISPATETKQDDLITAIIDRLGPLGQKNSSGGAPVTLSFENERTLDRLPTGIECLANSNLRETSGTTPADWVLTNVTGSYPAGTIDWRAVFSAAGNVAQLAFVTPEKRYRFAFTAKRVSGSGISMTPRIEFYTAADVLISTHDGASLASTTFARFMVDAVAPSNVGYIVVRMVVSGASTWDLRRCSLMAVEANLEGRFGGDKREKPVYEATINTAGNHDAITPPSGQRIRVLWVSFVPSQDNAAANLVRMGFGTTGGSISAGKYRGYALAHWEPFTGAANQSFIINTATSEPVAVTIHYEVLP